jgi:hypothetical protein
MSEDLLIGLGLIIVPISIVALVYYNNFLYPNRNALLHSPDQLETYLDVEIAAGDSSLTEWDRASASKTANSAYRCGGKTNTF